MRAVSFALTASVLFGLAKGESVCNYETLDSTKSQAFHDDCGAELVLTACDGGDQAMLDAAIATQLYSQCQCVYYDASTAFNYKVSGCWQKRTISDAGRCWTMAYKDFYVSGDLDAAIHAICAEDELPAPTTTPEPPAPTTTTTEPTGPVEGCVDDPNGILAKFPMTCAMVLPLVNGCTGATPFWFPYIFPGQTQETLCPASCNPDCPDQVESTDSCEDDPNGTLENDFNTNCEDMLFNIRGCDDPDGIVPLAVPGGTPETLCPASCAPRCQE